MQIRRNQAIAADEESATEPRRRSLGGFVCSDLNDAGQGLADHGLRGNSLAGADLRNCRQ